MSEEVVLVDSDEEGPVATTSAPSVHPPPPPLKQQRPISTPVMAGKAPLGGAVPRVVAAGSPRGGAGIAPTRVPKRPGAMPPFALFSQEMRAKLQAEDPDIGFGDLGRKLGEMWHALTEAEKEDYRRRARQVADAKMKTWKETMRSIPKHKQVELENSLARKRQMIKIKKKKTSGYAIFCSEFRRKYATENPEMPFSDISKKVAEDWRLVSDPMRREYEAKASKFNMEEERKWRHRMFMQQQQQQMKIQQQANRQQMMQKQQQRIAQQQYFQQQKQMQGGMRSPYGQQVSRQRLFNSDQNSSGLVISSVSSLSTSSSKDMPGLNLPSGITIHRAEPEINLPSSITISRVEPEIQIVEENIVPQSHPQQGLPGLRQSLQVKVGGVSRMSSGGSGRGARTALPPPLISSRGTRGRGPGRPPMMMGMANNVRGGSPNLGTPGLMRGRPMNSAGTGRVVQPQGSLRGRHSTGSIGMPTPRLANGVRGRGVMAGSTGLKRPLPPQPRSMAAGIPLIKRPRIPVSGISSYPAQHHYSTQGAVDPTSLSALQRLCRVCGGQSTIIFSLSDKAEVVERAQTLLKLKIDLKEDEEDGYPAVICRKCCNLVDTFYNFYKQVKHGQAILKTKIEERKKQLEAAQEITTEDHLITTVSSNPGSPGSIGIDPVVDNHSDQSCLIVPDKDQPDTQVGNIRIKQESLKGPSETAPMTTVFLHQEDVKPKIKVEPGLLDTNSKDKKEAKADNGDEAETSSVKSSRKSPASDSEESSSGVEKDKASDKKSPSASKTTDKDICDSSNKASKARSSKEDDANSVGEKEKSSSSPAENNEENETDKEEAAEAVNGEDAGSPSTTSDEKDSASKETEEEAIDNDKVVDGEHADQEEDDYQNQDQDSSQMEAEEYMQDRSDLEADNVAAEDAANHLRNGSGQHDPLNGTESSADDISDQVMDDFGGYDPLTGAEESMDGYDSIMEASGDGDIMEQEGDAEENDDMDVMEDQGVAAQEIEEDGLHEEEVDDYEAEDVGQYDEDAGAMDEDKTKNSEETSDAQDVGEEDETPSTTEDGGPAGAEDRGHEAEDVQEEDDEDNGAHNANNREENSSGHGAKELEEDDVDDGDGDGVGASVEVNTDDDGYEQDLADQPAADGLGSPLGGNPVPEENDDLPVVENVVGSFAEDTGDGFGPGLEDLTEQELYQNDEDDSRSGCDNGVDQEEEQVIGELGSQYAYADENESSLHK